LAVGNPLLTRAPRRIFEVRRAPEGFLAIVVDEAGEAHPPGLVASTRDALELLLGVTLLIGAAGCAVLATGHAGVRDGVAREIGATPDELGVLARRRIQMIGEHTGLAFDARLLTRPIQHRAIEALVAPDVREARIADLADRHALPGLT
jgi:hypothetical protein